MNATLHITPQIIEFARGVREQLADLPNDEVDDLTEGLEADLAEAFAEDLARELPDPAEYALELRTAAGLPPSEARVKGGIGQSFVAVAETIRLKRVALSTNIRQSALGAGFLDLLVEFRPLWWIMRAWVAYQLVGVFFGFDGPALPSDFPLWAILGLFVLVSVQWGRRHWLPAKGMGGLILLGNIVAVIALLPAVEHAYDSTQGSIETVYVGEDVGEPMAGVQLNGKDVTNIFAYGADGKAIEGIQLFDQDGHPLATSVPGGNGCLEGTPCVDQGSEDGAGVWVPSILETGAKAWNVFPMRMQTAKRDDMTGELKADPAATPQHRTPPFVKVPALMTPDQLGPEARAEKKGAENND